MASPPPSSSSTKMSAPTSPPPNNTKSEMQIPLPMELSNLGPEFNRPTSSASSFATTSTTSSRTQTPCTSGTSTPPTESFYSYSKETPSKSRHLCRVPQLDKNGQPLEALARKYHKPEEELDVAEALNTPALPGTVRHMLDRGVSGGSKAQRREETAEEKKADFERAKRELRGLG